MNLLKINDVFTNPTLNGIFNALQQKDVPWRSKYISMVLDTQYYYNHAGNKYISPLLINMLNGETELLTSQITAISNIIFNMYNVKWLKYYQIYNSEISLTDSKTETETLTNDITTLQHGKTETRTDNLTDTLAHNTTDTITYNTLDTLTPNTTETSENQIAAYNTSTYSNSGKTINTTTGTETNAKTGTETTVKTGSDTDTKTGTQTNASSGTDTHTRNFTKTKQYTDDKIDNIKDNFDFWMWNYFDMVFSDVDKVLTIDIY